MLTDRTDEELMVAYQLGDTEAFEVLYSRHADRVLGYLRRKVKSEALARDVFQATFLKLHRSRGRYDAAFPFAPWLFTICRNELLDALKKPHQIHESLVEEVPEAAFRNADPEPIPLDRLSPQQRKVIELRYEREFSFEEIAATLETSPANARQLVSRAIRVLRGFYEKK